MTYQYACAVKDRISWQKMAADSGQKEVIVVFKDRRRPIVFMQVLDRFSRRTPAHFGSCKNEVFADVLSSGEGSSDTSFSSSYYLQRDSKVWGHIDLNAKDKLADHEVLYIQLSKKSVSYVCCLQNR